MLGRFAIVNHDNDRLTGLCEMSAHGIVVIDIADYPATTMVIDHDALRGH